MAYLLAAAAAVLAIAVRPALTTPGNRWLDAALVLYVVVVAASLVPLPPGLRFAPSPSTRIIDLTLRIGDSAASSAAARPLSIDPAAGRVSLALATAMLLLFLSARTVFARGGLRLCVRAIAGLHVVTLAWDFVAGQEAKRLNLLGSRRDRPRRSGRT